jgi:tRNA(Ile)-lysidine synthase
MNLVKKFQNISHQHDLWQRGSRIILGVSGGPDSVCLLDIFAKLAPKYGLKLIITHVNYGLRGRDSDLDQKLVEKYASRNKFKSFVFKPKFKKSGNLENQLRDIRYDFFEKARRGNNFNLIAVGHNLDDQIETFLMRVVRGAGLTGLSAMKYNTNRIIRPLLGISRKEVIDYLKQNGLKYRIDKTNKEISFLRNKTRHKLIPYLEKNFNPALKKTLFDAISSIADDYNFLLLESLKAYQKNKQLKVNRLLSLHPAVLRGTLRLAIAEKKAELQDIEFSHVEEIIKIIKSKKSKTQIVSFKGLKIIKKNDKLTINHLTGNL